jgi:eukaryotic-like serine/threonine-protein kinase
MPLSVGTLVAGYRIEGVLGAGGMGTVYLARHPTLPRNDALKILSSELSLDRQFRTRFTREADLAATLNHPNIVRVYNRGETDDGQLWIAMEYVDGTTAGDLDRAHQTLARIVRIITDVATALDYAHSRRILHRDIKPGNFLVSGPGTDHERVLLADFGIARALDDATALTATGLLVGTAAYAAPESIEGGPLDHRADIYSLGCTLFRLLTGHTPYDDAGSLPAMVMAHLMRPIPRPSTTTPGLSPAIDDVIATAMAKNPDERFNTAGALAAATASALTGHPPPTSTTAHTSGPHPHNSTNPTLTYPPTWPPAPGHSPALPPAYLPPSDPARAGAANHAPTPHQFPSGPTPIAHLGQPGAGPRPRRKRARLIAAVTGLVVTVAAATTLTIHLMSSPNASLDTFTPQALSGKFGAITLQHRPVTIAALGPGDPDAVLSLGVQPAVMAQPQATVPSWLQPLLHSSPPVFAAADPASVAAAKPDLIIDTGDIDQPTYVHLSAIAPTLTKPADIGQDWTWQTQLTWIATALGRADTAKNLLNDAASQQNKVRSDHPAFAGKSIVAVNYTGTTTTTAARISPPTSYLDGIGFMYNRHYQRKPSDPPDIPFAITDFDTVGHRSDVLLLLRTDPAAGGGGYSGLPASYGSYGGILVIIDDPATITALTTGGPAATTYLNNALVSKLGNQIH